ncbi:MAG: hypothetical protein IJV14_05480 [Lachnospiraceae bacterium]|nr:hypothetical protein [Lachnospiraceae bacterium]
MVSVNEILMICESLGEGQKLTKAVIEYKEPVDASSLTAESFAVKNRTVTGVSLCGRDPRRVIVALSASDEDAALTYFENPGPGETWKRRPASLMIRQCRDLRTVSGDVLPAWEDFAAGQKEIEAVADRFTQHVFHSDRTGRDLPYNLFLPDGYDEGGSYPLVMFIHDRGPLSEDPKTALRQGNGATIWASDEVQKEHPCIVLAPQFARVPCGDGEPDMLETTFDLYEDIMDRYAVDRKRLYTTGQSMGCMSSIEMGIRRPDFFTAFLLVAGQWDAGKMKVLKDAKMTIIVSRGDPRAFSGMNEALVSLDDAGAQIEFSPIDQPEGIPDNSQMEELLARPANIHYAVLKTRVRGFECHMGTWKVAYGIKAARDWLFVQSK